MNVSTRQIQLFTQAREGQDWQLAANRVQGGGADLSPSTRARIFEQKLAIEYGQLKPLLGGFSSAIAGAKGPVQITGNPGAIVPRTWLGTFVGDVWVEWSTDAEVTIDAHGFASVAATCGSNGTPGNLPAGAQLRMVPALTGISADVFVLEPGIIGGH